MQLNLGDFMKIESNNYIPVRHLPDRPPLTNEEKEITKEIIDIKKRDYRQKTANNC